MESVKIHESERHLEALKKGLEVLDHIGRSPSCTATLTEIAAGLGVYKSRVIRLCGTLEFMGYLVHDRKARLYRLGPRLLSLGKAYERDNPLVTLIKPVLEYLHQHLQLTASFYILRGLKRVCIGKVTTRYGWDLTSEGQERELHYGSTGKIFLAFGPQELREEFFASPEPYTRLTPFTLTTAKEVWDEIVAVRQNGYASSREERVMGFAGLAVPVFDAEGALTGALSIAGDALNFTDERVSQWISVLLQQRDEIALGRANPKK